MELAVSFTATTDSFATPDVGLLPSISMSHDSSNGASVRAPQEPRSPALKDMSTFTRLASDMRLKAALRTLLLIPFSLFWLVGFALSFFLEFGRTHGVGL